MTDNCWNKIGVYGDRSCRELQTYVHCHNCPVYSTSGRNFLEQEAPPGYLEEWTNLLAHKDEKIDTQTDRSTVLAIVFRLGREWLALRASLFKEVMQPCVVRTLPHQSNEILLGIANIRGEIIPCISMSHFLGIECTEPTSAIGDLGSEKIDRNSENLKSLIPIQSSIYKRMVVLEQGKKIWVFRVDEISGTYRCSQDKLQVSPVIASKSTNSYIKGIFNWNQKKVNYLDDELLFDTLERKLL